MACTPERVTKLLELIDDLGNQLIELENGPLHRLSSKYATMTQDQMSAEITKIQITVNQALSRIRRGVPYAVSEVETKEPDVS